jgi:hypothetical protein
VQNLVFGTHHGIKALNVIGAVSLVGGAAIRESLAANHDRLLLGISGAACVGIHAGDITSLVASSRKLGLPGPTCRIAIVAEEPVAFGLSRMFTLMRDDDESRITVHSTLADATARLEQPLAA